MAYRLGVDLGTTYTAAAIVREGRAEIVSIGTRGPVVPSVIFLRDDNQILIGEAANRRATTEPGRVAREFKRRMGDPTPLLLGGSPMSPQSLMAKLLRWTIDQVAEREGGPPDHVAVSHPANWGPFKLDLLQQAVRLADLGPTTMLTEPEAAATYYASTARMQAGEVVAVYDLGGGTFDVAVLRKTDVGFDILGSPEGIEHLGGIDVDEAVFAYVIAAVGGSIDDLDPDDPSVIAAMARLRNDCVEAKEALSNDTEDTIPVMLPGIQTSVTITRAQLESMVRPWLSDTIAALRRALRSAEVEPAGLRAVLLVGGASRMPLVSALVSQELGRPVAVDAHPKHAIALGAALAADQTAAREHVRPAAPVTIITPPPTPSAADMHAAAEATDENDDRRALVAGFAAGGIGFAGTAAAAGLLDAAASTGAAAAASTGAAALGPAGLGPVGAPFAAGPTGTPFAAGPTGTPFAAGPTGAPVTVGPSGSSMAAGPAGSPMAPPAPPAPPTQAPPPRPRAGRAAKKVARRIPKRAIVIGTAAGVTVAAAATAGVVATRSNDNGGAAATTISVTVPTSAPVIIPTTVAETSSTSSSTSTSTLPPTTVPATQRGLSGTVSLVAGNGRDDGLGRPAPASEASLGNNAHFAVAPDGDIFVINHENQVVLIHDGQMSTLYTANGAAGEAGVGGVAIGPDGAAYVTMGRFIKRVAADGTTSTVFDSTAAGIPSSLGVITFDGAGNMYFYHNNTYRVLRRGTDGSLSQVAGTGNQGRIGEGPQGDGGPALASPIATATGLAVDATGNLLIADTGNRCIRKVAPDGTISTIAGGGQSRFDLNGGNFAPDGTLATELNLGSADSVAIDGKGRIYVGDPGDHAAFRFGSDGKIELVIADQVGTTQDMGYPANQTRGTNVYNVAIDAKGDLLFAQRNLILRIAGAGK